MFADDKVQQNTELRPLINVKILFLLNMLRMNCWIVIKFCLCIYSEKIKCGDNYCLIDSTPYENLFLV